MSITAAAIGIAAVGSYAFLRSKTDNIWADLKFIHRLVSGKREATALVNRGDWTIADFWEEHYAKGPDDLLMICVDTGKKYTYRDFENESNRVANWARNQDIKPRAVVAVMLDNSPEFVFTWLGLAKIGAVAALVNTNLKGVALLNTLMTSKANDFIIGKDFCPEVATHAAKLPNVRMFALGGATPGFIDLDKQLSLASLYPVPRNLRAGIGALDPLLYIYTSAHGLHVLAMSVLNVQRWQIQAGHTFYIALWGPTRDLINLLRSGTTGLPKAAIINHLRYWMGASVFTNLYDVSQKDCYYCPLPMYHSSGGMIGTGVSWMARCPLVVRKRFSASSFWTDIRRNNVTVMQYIGELCRYLLAQPAHPDERAHKLRLAIGNGMRPDVWAKFQERFNVPEIGEFYASTEGNASLIYRGVKIGSIGKLSDLLMPVYPVKLIKFDVEKEEAIRDPKTGLCIACKPGDIGELVGLINDDDPLRKFAGYTDPAATEKKGDRYFRTGDLLSRDKYGYFFFIDRIGDTFRWKGENVSTNEVADCLAAVGGVIEANVYGVQVPHHDGRAGMASLVVEPATFKLDELYTQSNKDAYSIRKNLASYAAPLFLRIKTEIETTTTFKYKKVDLQKEGFSPAMIREPLYYRDDKAGKFVPLTPALYDQICAKSATSKL